MLYLERIPRAPLNRFVRMLWYAKAPQVTSGRERILPNGCVQVIVNLARDYLLDCPEGQPDRAMAPALVVGCRSVYEIVDRSDMAELVGIVFEPGGFASFVGGLVDRFANQSIPLEDLWGPQARSLRERLHEGFESGGAVPISRGLSAGTDSCHSKRNSTRRGIRLSNSR